MPQTPGTQTPGSSPGDRVALVLDAGGARSAYQVGALGVLLPELARRGQRPVIQIGTSAGALITAAMVGTAHLDAEEQAERLVGVLGEATKRHVMRPLWRQVPVVAARYFSETVGLSGFRLRGLFGTAPLARTLGRSIDWSALHRNLGDGVVEVAAVTATAVRTGQVVLFAESARRELPAAPPSHHHRFTRTRLDVQHLMASSAIPVLFPSVRVDAPSDAVGWYADGATRRRTVVAPALKLGADRVVVVGTGSLEQPEPDLERDRVAVDLGDGGATLLGAVMDDPLRHDLRRLAAVNELAADPAVSSGLDQHRVARGQDPYRVVPYVAVAPQRGDELAGVAMEVYRSNHGSLRATLGDPDLQVMHRLMGSDSPLQGELLSYLLFDPDFFDAAAELGRRDALAWIDAEPDLWRTSAVRSAG